MPTEYWEYRLVDRHFRGDWLTYWRMPEPLINMILKFMEAEGEANELQEKRLRRDYGRSKHGFGDSN